MSKCVSTCLLKSFLRAIIFPQVPHINLAGPVPPSSHLDIMESSIEFRSEDCFLLATPTLSNHAMYYNILFIIYIISSLPCIPTTAIQHPPLLISLPSLTKISIFSKLCRLQGRPCTQAGLDNLSSKDDLFQHVRQGS